jgi:hypothetical protein
MRSFLLGLACVVVAMPVSAQGVAEARAALRAGEYEEAIDLYEDLLDENPGAVQARVSLIEALIAVGSYEDAIETGRAAPNQDAVANASARSNPRSPKEVPGRSPPGSTSRNSISTGAASTMPWHGSTSSSTCTTLPTAA